MKAAKKATCIGLPLLGLLCLAAFYLFGANDDAFTEEGLLRTNASDLKHTIVTPHLEAPVASGKNVLWCGSFQLAWNEACTLVGEDLHFRGKEPAMVGALNRKSFTKQHVDAESYVAVAGFVKDDIHGQIARQLEKKFKGQAIPRYVPPKQLTPRPQDIVTYSYLFKNLEFQVPFERIEKPVVFGTEKVSCFGIAEKHNIGQAGMLGQLTILDYQSEDDCVIAPKTKSPDDRLILAKTRAEETLDLTIKAVQKRAANPEPIQPKLGDVLKVPRLNFDITRRYGELEGKKLTVKNPGVAKDLLILSAVQNTRFQLDEKGVRLRSESHVAFGCSKPSRPPPRRYVMVFDKPFLIVLQKSHADVPYLALWVGDPELLVRVKK